LTQGCLKLGDETVSCIGETCGGLTELDVSGRPMLSPDPVARLRSLRLADCAKLTAAGVADCALSCEALQLCISRASLQKLVFTDVIAAMASASLCRLRKLHVDGCAVTRAQLAKSLVSTLPCNSCDDVEPRPASAEGTLPDVRGRPAGAYRHCVVCCCRLRMDLTTNAIGFLMAHPGRWVDLSLSSPDGVVRFAQSISAHV
jgi:hypothetical protein